LNLTWNQPGTAAKPRPTFFFFFVLESETQKPSSVRLLPRFQRWHGAPSGGNPPSPMTSRNDCGSKNPTMAHKIVFFFVSCFVSLQLAKVARVFFFLSGNGVWAKEATALGECVYLGLTSVRLYSNLL
jgi:hypothetical protein